MPQHGYAVKNIAFQLQKNTTARALRLNLKVHVVPVVLRKSSRASHKHSPSSLLESSHDQKTTSGIKAYRCKQTVLGKVGLF
jgi:hypothetical protein